MRHIKKYCLGLIGMIFCNDIDNLVFVLWTLGKASQVVSYF